MMTPEGKVKAKIDALLRKYGAYQHKPVQNGLGTPALDYHCCVNGYYLGIEAKEKGKKPTLRQQNTIDQIRRSGGLAIVVDGSDNYEHLQQLLEELTYGKGRGSKRQPVSFDVLDSVTSD